MSDDQFTKLFKRMEKGFSYIDKRFDKQDAEIAELKGAVAELGGQIRDYYQEMIMIAHQELLNNIVSRSDRAML